jgi:hypothetical protein
MSFVVCGLFVLVFVWALATNRDVLSPAKFFLFSFLVFHVGALSDSYSYELWMLILLVLLVGATTVLFEASDPLPPQRRGALLLRRSQDPGHFALWMWVLSLPSMAAQGFLFWKFGGLQGYVNMLGSRVLELRGAGWALTLSAAIVTLNLAYFVVGLTRSRSRLWWSVYGVHLLLALAVGLLSGSRSALLNTFAIQLFCYHYIRREVSVSRALPIAVALVAGALLLGAVRNAVKFEDDALSVGLSSGQPLQLSAFKYGIQPLQILLEADRVKPVYGMTLVSVVTNLVPRAWWPDKPDTGGVYFTKQYTGNAWGGLSNLTPTLLGEFVINFGWGAGIAIYALVYPAIMYLVVRYYRRVVVRARATGGSGAAFEILLYVSLMWAMVGLMVAEVTTTVVTLVTIRVLPLLLLKAAFGQPLRRAAGLRSLTPRDGMPLD